MKWSTPTTKQRTMAKGLSRFHEKDKHAYRDKNAQSKGEDLPQQIIP